MNDSVLFINHREKNCGVYQYGLSTYQNVSDLVTYIEANSRLDVDIYAPGKRILLFNFYPGTMPFVTKDYILHLRSFYKVGVIYHEVPLDYFDFYVHVDPTFQEYENHFKVGRPLLTYAGNYPANDTPTFGSFGFGFGNKGWKLFIEKVQEEFDKAVINLRIPPAKFGDEHGESARRIGEACRQFIYKPGIKLNVFYDFLEQQALLEYLAGNDMNVFLYDDEPGRGPASVTDFALSVKRPIAITDSNRFNHLRGEKRICIEYHSLREILAYGTSPLEKFYNQFSKENLIKDYSHVFNSVQ